MLVPEIKKKKKKKREGKKIKVLKYHDKFNRFTLKLVF